MTGATRKKTDDEIENLAARIRDTLGGRSIVLIGMMGAGKSAIGRLVAKALKLPFVDADIEIERAAGMTIADMFETHGEAYFRDGEVRVISRILDGAPTVLATGGGAWMNEDTRAHAAGRGLSVWLKADADVLMKRVKRRSNRPLLKTADPEATLRQLLEVREPFYALADITVLSRDVPHEAMVRDTMAAIADHLAALGSAA
jgi:shikimate kinase